MDWVVKLIEQLKTMTIKRILLFLVSAVIVLLIWKIDPILNYLGNKSNQAIHTQAQAKSEEALKQAESVKPLIYNAHDINNLTDIDLAKINSSFEASRGQVPAGTEFVAIYKFLPGMQEFEYQGRILILFRSTSKNPERTPEQEVAKELDLLWVPIWSGKEVVGELLENKPVYSTVNSETHVFVATTKDGRTLPDTVPTRSIDGLANYNIKSVYRYPIRRSNRTVGYVSLYLSSEIGDTATLEEYSSRLSGKISAYMVSD